MADHREVVITGLGPVTAMGTGCDKLWSSLKEGRNHIEQCELPVDVGRMITLPIAKMQESSRVPGLDTHLSYLQNQECGGYRDLAYALLAVELAIGDAGLEYDRDHNSLGAIQVFEAPGVENTVSKLFQMMGMPMPADQPPQVYDLLAPDFYKMQPFIFVHLLSKAFCLRGFSTSVHNACSSGAFAMDVAAQRIRSGQQDVMIVVGGEAYDTAVRLEWFRRLELYAKETVMRPFGDKPTGFYVGEGAAAIVLESADHAQKRNARIYAQYSGGAFAHQGWKQMIPDIRSARLKDVIAEALQIAAQSVEEIDLIVPHGTATKLSDGYEANCLESALDGKAERAVATVYKPAVGHMLASSGIIETVCALLSMKHDVVTSIYSDEQQSVNFPVPMAMSCVDRPIHSILKLFTGFTGHDAALIFKKV